MFDYNTQFSMSFFRYPGGKKKLINQITPKISALINANCEITEYREPFFGGGSVGLDFLTKSSGISSFWINDKDISLACLWTAVIKYNDEFIERVNNTFPSVELFYSIKEELLNLDTHPSSKEDVLDIALKKLLIHQSSFSGLGTKSGGPLGGKDQSSKYKIDCRWSPKYIVNKIDKFKDLTSEITFKHDGCTSLDFEQILLDSSVKCFIYLDPPYYIKGNDLYQHGFSLDDHQRLSTILKNTGHTWLMSYDDCSEIRELYKWAHVIELDVNYSIAKATRKKEVLITNPENHVIL